MTQVVLNYLWFPSQSICHDDYFTLSPISVKVARGDVVYNEKADIFSLGMLLYELATEGKQPFSDLKFRNEFDEAVITGRPIDPIIVADAPPWPYMQELLDHMLVTEPEDRPTAEQVRKLLAV